MLSSLEHCTSSQHHKHPPVNTTFTSTPLLTSVFTLLPSSVHTALCLSLIICSFAPAVWYQTSIQCFLNWKSLLPAVQLNCNQFFYTFKHNPPVLKRLQHDACFGEGAQLRALMNCYKNAMYSLLSAECKILNIAFGNKYTSEFTCLSSSCQSNRGNKRLICSPLKEIKNPGVKRRIFCFALETFPLKRITYGYILGRVSTWLSFSLVVF